MGSGDGWTQCGLGHTHWGRFGAAGLLISDGTRVILQHRAPWTHEGGTWGIPGGARDGGETAVAAALREAREEAGLREGDVEPVGLYEINHGGWSYTTVLARPRVALHPAAMNAESVDVRWVPIADVDALPLHAGFSVAWPDVRRQPEPLLVLISQHLRDDPAVRLLNVDGIAGDALPAHIDTGALHRVLPRIEYVASATAAGERAALVEGTSVMVLDRADLCLLLEDRDAPLR